MEHAEKRLYDVYGIAGAPDLAEYVPDARGLKDLVYIRVAADTEAAWMRAEDDAVKG